MHYITAWTDALHLCNLHIPTTINLPSLHFIPLHYTYVTFTSPPRLTSLHFTLLHSTSLHLCNLHIPTTINIPPLHFTSLHLLWYPPHLHFTSLITFLILFLKLRGVKETVPKTPAGSSFQSWRVLIPLLDLFLFYSFTEWALWQLAAFLHNTNDHIAFYYLVYCA
jgi:hypothetical protein